MGKNFQQNFNTITNIFLLFILFLGGFVWADTNGVWHRAEDVQGGVFGSDENPTNYTFNNDVYFNSYLRKGVYYIDINGVTGLNDLRSEKITSNAAEINGNLTVNGNVGIGTVNPRGSLDVNGNVFIGTTHPSGPQLALMGTNNDWIISNNFANGESFNLGSQPHTTGLTTSRLTVTNSGNIGIGTVNPTQKLDVNGDIKAGNIYADNFIRTNSNIASWSGIDMYINNSNRSTVYNDFNFPGSVAFDTPGGGAGSLQKMIIRSNGNVGIGTTNPSEKLDVNGNVKISGKVISLSTTVTDPENTLATKDYVDSKVAIVNNTSISPVDMDSGLPYSCVTVVNLVQPVAVDTVNGGMISASVGSIVATTAVKKVGTNYYSSVSFADYTTGWVQMSGGASSGQISNSLGTYQVNVVNPTKFTVVIGYYSYGATAMLYGSSTCGIIQQ